jgi:hypothetical protein
LAPTGSKPRKETDVTAIAEALDLLRRSEKILAPWKSNHPDKIQALAQAAGHWEAAGYISLIYLQQAIQVLEERKET